MTAAKQLCVNIDHVATLRQARLIGIPSVLAAAKVVESVGAKGITVHLREDRRHIQDADVTELRANIRYLNLEMANTEEMVRIALKVRPDAVCLVPEKRAELTTEGGLNVVRSLDAIAGSTRQLSAAGIKVSLFVEPEMDQIKASADAGAAIVELHTGKYAEFPNQSEIKRLQEAAYFASQCGLIVHAGHGLAVENLPPIIAIPEIEDLNIGFSIVANAVFKGLSESIQDVMKAMAV